MEAFSDGVIAIIITIMVLELKLPHGSSFQDLVPLLPVFLSYTLSFIYVGIYWNNHHHLLQATPHISGRILWANLHWLFWLSLTPFVTSWAGENHFAEGPVALYGFGLLMNGISYTILAKTLVSHAGKDSLLAKAMGRDLKGLISIVLYLVGIGVAFFAPLISCLIYVMVAAMWLIPDTRIEKRFSKL